MHYALIGVSLSEPHIHVAVVPFALLSVRLLPVLADWAKIDRMWVPTNYYLYLHSTMPFRKFTFLDIYFSVINPRVRAAWTDLLPGLLVCMQRRLPNKARKIESAIAYLTYTIGINNSSGKPHNALHPPSIIST